MAEHPLRRDPRGETEATCRLRVTRHTLGTGPTQAVGRRAGRRGPVCRPRTRGAPVTEAVIVAAARTPIGRAFKGSLKDVRPDDLSVQVVRGLLDQLPSLDPSTIDDLYWGCADPSGKHGSNLARVVAVLAGMDHLPAATVNRFCASSTQTMRMAFHAIKAGEGDTFIACGVESLSRTGGRGFTRDDMNPRFVKGNDGFINEVY